MNSAQEENSREKNTNSVQGVKKEEGYHAVKTQGATICVSEGRINSQTLWVEAVKTRHLVLEIKGSWLGIQFIIVLASYAKGPWFTMYIFCPI